MTVATVDDVARTFSGRRSSPLVARVLVPVGAVVLALAVGAVLITIEGAPPVDVYRSAWETVATGRFGWRDTLVEATPLVLIGLGLAVAYRARVFTIGAEGQYLVGATAAVAVVTAPAFASGPGPLLVIAGAAAAAACGAGWSAISAWLLSRFGTSVVISSLLLNYVGAALLAWAIRIAIRDPEGFVPQSRQLGRATLAEIPGLDTHAGVVIAAAAVVVAAVVVARTRWGFLVDVHGHNADALDAQEIPRRRLVLGVLVACGAMAGLAGFIQVAGVNGRLNASTGVGYGFTAIVVAVLGRLRPVGVALAAVLLSALAIGFEGAERDFDLPASLVGIIQALIVLFVVLGDGAVARWGRG
jgi:simple sugar transport system permease protein